ncbi:MAG: response regulator [Magnetococcales bacterium]|nr:response regulator [Magnetococcales bacterium]
MNTSILIVEDEQDLISTLTYNLEKAGYLVQSALSGEEGLTHIQEGSPPDLLLLDLMLPGISGLEVCRRIRTTPDTQDLPILMLTARGEGFDRIVGFETGVDDYLVKPFNIRELLLRIQALLRRKARYTLPPDAEKEITFGRIWMDLEGHQVTVQGKDINLTVLEFKLLTTLISRRGLVQSRDTLLNDVWGISAMVQTRTVDAHIKRLREKLGVVGHYLETIRGVGYRFRSHPGEEEI